MSLDMIRPRNETDLLLSITKNYQTHIHQTHTKPQETLEFKLIKPRKTFSSELSINLGLDSKWMVGLTSLEVYISIFNITEENNKFKLYTDNFDEFSFAELQDELEEILSIPDITPTHLQHEIIGLRIIGA